jgi:hypothetical protein
MRVISDPSDLDFEPFGPPVQDWFRARTDDRLPPLESGLLADGALAAYRKVGAVQHEPLSIVYQQAGEALELLYGKPISGKTLDQLYNDWFRGKAYEGYRLMIEAGRPVYERRMISTIVRKIGYHHLYLLFGSDRVTHAVSYILPTEDAISCREDWESMVKATPWLEG